MAEYKAPLANLVIDATKTIERFNKQVRLLAQQVVSELTENPPQEEQYAHILRTAKLVMHHTESLPMDSEYIIDTIQLFALFVTRINDTLNPEEIRDAVYRTIPTGWTEEPTELPLWNPEVDEKFQGFPLNIIKVNPEVDPDNKREWVVIAASKPVSCILKYNDGTSFEVIVDKEDLFRIPSTECTLIGSYQGREISYSRKDGITLIE